MQVIDTITPGNEHYSEKSRLAKTIQQDGVTWGDVPADQSKLAHANSRMTCYACHSSWAPTCYGCHLSMTANAAHSHAAQRGPDHAQLDLVQLPGIARRHLHARHRRDGNRASRRAGSLGMRGRGEFAEQRPRLALLPAADDFGRGLQRAGFLHVCAAHRSRERNQGLHGLPRVASRRQQCVDGPAAVAGHELYEFHGALRVRRRSARVDSRPLP